MENKNNKNLFWYGFLAKVKSFFGALLIVIGIFTLLGNTTIGITLFILGLILFFSGKQQRFDYKMQSGTMVHRGDW